MGLFRLYAIRDTYITNRVTYNGASTRATGSNFGGAPTNRILKLTSSQPNQAVELSRALLQFDSTYLSGLVFSENKIPASGVSYFLKSYDFPIGTTVPTSFDLKVFPVSRSWDEGLGIDESWMRDYGYANWQNATSTTPWTSPGGDYLTASYGSGTQHFDHGTEDLEVDVTSIVNAWLSGGLPGNGFIIKLGDTEESNSTDYYCKTFYSRHTQTVERIPYLEARWNDIRRDNRKNFALNISSSLYLYNVVRGALADIASPVYVRLQDNLMAQSCSYNATLTASRVDTGIYSASLYLTQSAGLQFSGTWTDIWYTSTGVCMSGAFDVAHLTSSAIDPYFQFVAQPNLKREYRSDELAHVRVNVRREDFQNHYVPQHTASSAMPREYIEDMYYSILNDETGETMIPFSTGSQVPYTKLSYDGNGNYFNLWMNSFIPGFTYRILFLINFNKYEKTIINDDFLFKVL